jgi:arabinan endo-1,5-alpha-L-arabinosidase
MFAGQGGVIPSQDVTQVSTNWPTGNIGLRMANYMCQAQQKWTIEPVAEAGLFGRAWDTLRLWFR